MHINIEENRATSEEIAAANEGSHHELPWYAVSTRYRQEKLASMILESMGIAHFLPVIDEERKWSDRKKVVTLPLFPGYMFVQAALTNELQLSVRKVRGIIDFVGNHCGPLTVPQREIENVRKSISWGSNCAPHPLLTIGERVLVVRGALTGVEGTLIRHGARSRIVISVEIIQRAVSVDVAISDVEPIGDTWAQQKSHLRVA